MSLQQSTSTLFFLPVSWTLKQVRMPRQTNQVVLFMGSKQGTGELKNRCHLMIIQGIYINVLIY